MHQVFTLRPLFLHSEIRSAHRATLFRPFSCCNSVLIIKKHPRTADSIRDSHILSATIQEYSFTLFNLPQVAVSFDAYTADAEFALSKREYFQLTGRRQDSDVIAYQVRQSFRPGEITPEEANRIGYEFAERFLKGNHAFIVCTHTDKQHIHNHIYWNSTSLDCTRKFRNFWGSTMAVRKLSDLICVQHRLSVIDNPKPHGISYNRWQGDIEKLSNRDRLCLDMDAALAKKPHDLEGFYSLMEQAGYTVARGKNITFSHPRQKRNIRMRSLPEEYREDAIREVLAGRRIHNPRKRRSPLAEQKAQLVSALEAKQNQGRGRYYDLSIQNQITKQQAKALLYYQQHGFTSADDFDAFAESVEAVKQRKDALSAQITSAEKRLNEIAVLQKHITNYLKTKDIYAGYRASGYSKAYYEEHEDAIKLCKASKRAFDELLPSDTSGKTAGSHKKQLPSMKALRAEYAELLAMKKAAYPEYYKAKDEYRELLTYQANLAGLFGIENVRSAPQREHQQEEK